MAEKRAAAVTQDPLMAVLSPALKVGAACGTTGFIVGGAAGILRNTTPFLFASASGLQTFALGTTFWATRSTIIAAWMPADQKPTASDLTKASTLSGCITGGVVGAILRGRSNVLPGAVMFSIFGALGQTTYTSMSTRRNDPDQEFSKGFWRRMSEKSWSPVSVMSNEEYAELLKQKMMKVEVEISILDDRIAALRQEQQQKAVREDMLPQDKSG